MVRQRARRSCPQTPGGRRGSAPRGKGRRLGGWETKSSLPPMPLRKSEIGLSCIASCDCLINASKAPKMYLFSLMPKARIPTLIPCRPFNASAASFIILSQGCVFLIYTLSNIPQIYNFVIASYAVNMINITIRRLSVMQHPCYTVRSKNRAANTDNNVAGFLNMSRLNSSVAFIPRFSGARCCKTCKISLFPKQQAGFRLISEPFIQCFKARENLKHPYKPLIYREETAGEGTGEIAGGECHAAASRVREST